MQMTLKLKSTAKKKIGKVIYRDKNLVGASGLVKVKLKQWKGKKLYLFFLPTYNSEVNIIERKWHQIKDY